LALRLQLDQRRPDHAAGDGHRRQRDARREEQASTPDLRRLILYLAYVVSIGGDFMRGRFFTMPLLASVALLGSLRFDEPPPLFPSSRCWHWSD